LVEEVSARKSSVQRLSKIQRGLYPGKIPGEGGVVGLRKKGLLKLTPREENFIQLFKKGIAGNI